MLDAILAPLRDLLHRYDEAAAVIADVTAGLEDMLDAREQGQAPGTTSAHEDRRPAGAANQPGSLWVEVGAASPDAVLAFVDGLRSLPGVQHVTVAGATSARTNFLVELQHHEPAETALEGSLEPAGGGRHALVCVHCLRVIVPGGPDVSHGLCPDCLEPFISQAARPDTIAEGGSFALR